MDKSFCLLVVGIHFFFLKVTGRGENPPPEFSFHPALKWPIRMFQYILQQVHLVLHCGIKNRAP